MNPPKTKIKKILASCMISVMGLLAAFTIFVSLGSQPALAAATCGTATNLKGNCVTKDINLIINFLSAGVGLIVVGVIIMGGIQYSMAGDSPEALKKAKERIINGLVALFAFMFLYAFLQWLVPGGVFF